MSTLRQKVLAEWELINRLAVRRFGPRPLAEEAALAVMEGLRENNWRRVRGYQGRAPFPAYLATVSWRLLEDFARVKFGRRRPPRWLRHLGGIWVKLFSLLCLERLTVDDAISLAQQEYNQLSPAEVESAAWTIRERIVDCGSHQMLEVSLQELERGSFGPATGHGREEVEYEEKERTDIFLHLFQVLTDMGEELVQQNMRVLTGLQIVLEPEEKLLLKLCFQDDFSVAQAGKMLGYNRDQAYGRLRRLLARLRREFEQAGLAQEMLELLT